MEMPWKCPGNAFYITFISLLTFINIKSTTIRVPLPAFLASYLTVKGEKKNYGSDGSLVSE